MRELQPEIAALLADRSEAMRTKNLDRLMSLYSPGIVYFDLVPPLQYVGEAALRGRFSEWFERWEGEIGQEISHLSVSGSGDFAAAHMLIRASGALKTGHEVGYWVRATNAFVRSDSRWRITHEHVSLPVNLPAGNAAMDLMP